jgi:hypothetical protein
MYAPSVSAFATALVPLATRLNVSGSPSASLALKVPLVEPFGLLVIALSLTSGTVLAFLIVTVTVAIFESARTSLTAALTESA